MVVEKLSWSRRRVHVAAEERACAAGVSMWPRVERSGTRGSDNKKLMAARKAGGRRVGVIGASVARDAGLNPLIYSKPPGSASLHPGPHAVACCAGFRHLFTLQFQPNY